MDTTGGEVRTRPGADLRRVSMIALMLLLPVELLTVITTVPGVSPGYNREIVFMLFDIALIVLAVAALPDLIRRIGSGRLPLGLATIAILVALGLVALAFHPTWRSVYTLLRLAAAVVVVAEISQLDRSERRARVAGPLLVATSIQGVIATAQAVTGSPLGIGFGELDTLRVFGESVAGSGTLAHPYVLAALAALSVTVAIALLPDRGRGLWLLGIFLTGLGLGVTYSRSAAFGLVFAVGALAVGAVRNPRRYRAATAVLVAAVVGSALLFGSGWAARVDESTTGSLEEISSSRITHLRQARDVIESSPFVGVGPGNYTIVLERDFDPVLPDAVHGVPVLVAAEDGIVAGLAYLVLMFALAWRALRTSPAAFAVAASLAGFMAFDKLTYLHPNGLIMFAVWLGVLDGLAADRQDLDPVADAGIAATQPAA